MLKIRRLVESDIDFVNYLCDLEGWGYLPADIKRCIKYEPNGCFIAEEKDKLRHLIGEHICFYVFCIINSALF